MPPGFTGTLVFVKGKAICPACQLEINKTGGSEAAQAEAPLQAVSPEPEKKPAPAAQPKAAPSAVLSAKPKDDIFF